jgi:hypothetical protein
MRKQTAVEWLVDELLSGKLLMPSLIDQAKQMEMEQIAKAWERRAMDVTGYDYYRLYHGKLPIGDDND